MSHLLSVLVFVFVALTTVNCNHVNLARISRLAAGAPPSVPIEQFFTQLVDHFNPQNTSTYQQRYFVNSTFSANSGPIFLYVGGESELTPRRVTVGEVVELAQQYQATVVAVEHRYYGKSQPTDTWSTSDLRFLSAEQALEDLATFVGWFIQQNNLQNRKWFVFGGSYPGSLSAWFRLKFPQLVVGSLASSAPVLAWEDFYMYDQVIAAAVGASCANYIRQATALVQAQLPAVKTQFGCGMINNDAAFMYVLADTVAYAVQYGNKAKLCEMMATPGDPISIYAEFVQYTFNTTSTTPVDWDLESFTSTEIVQADNMRQWMYQSCTEFGYWQTAPAQNSLRSDLITVAWHRSVCAKLFGMTLIPDTTATNLRYGGNNTAGTNIFFVNGGDDPWHVLSVQTTLSASEPALIIPNEAHTPDLRASLPTDSAALRAARVTISQYVAQWLGVPTCPAQCSGNGQCLAGGVCQCNAGYGGADCSVPEAFNWKPVIAGLVAAIIGIPIVIVVVLCVRRRCAKTGAYGSFSTTPVGTRAAATYDDDEP